MGKKLDRIISQTVGPTRTTADKAKDAKDKAK